MSNCAKEESAAASQGGVALALGDRSRLRSRPLLWVARSLRAHLAAARGGGAQAMPIASEDPFLETERPRDSKSGQAQSSQLPVGRGRQLAGLRQSFFWIVSRPRRQRALGE